MRVPLLLVMLVLAGTAGRADAIAPEAARVRVEHHLKHAEELTSHFEHLIAASCERFPTRAAWDSYIDAETDRLTLLMAHLEQAWVEAKRTPDDEVRRAAKAPRRQADQMRVLMEKFTTCAELNGTTFAPGPVWRRVEREVPRRQAEIALPE